ncbi:MAG: hypothetical protein MRJ68_22460, partial [Nitrospira sp.]|nr:hypothetical protein [Nitrospira sp.]
MNRPNLPHSLLRCSYTLCLLLILIDSPIVATASPPSEVEIWLEADQAVASSQLSGRREIPLSTQETVISSGTNGINAIVVTSHRLLGFSSRALTWTKIE